VSALEVTVVGLQLEYVEQPFVEVKDQVEEAREAFDQQEETQLDDVFVTLVI
jgi:hypothetical protein